MRIGVLLLEQDPRTESPRHFVSRQLSARILNDYVNGRRMADEISKKVIHVRIEMTFSQIKERYKKNGTVIIPRIHPPRKPETLMLSYPPLNQESDGRAKQKALWLNATRF